jgi:hypothetical protein
MLILLKETWEQRGKQKNALISQEINAYLESVSGIPLLPTTVLTDRFKGSSFNLLNSMPERTYGSSPVNWYYCIKDTEECQCKKEEIDKYSRKNARMYKKAKEKHMTSRPHDCTAPAMCFHFRKEKKRNPCGEHGE